MGGWSEGGSEEERGRVGKGLRKLKSFGMKGRASERDPRRG